MNDMGVIFLGIPGSGKTVLLSAFALAYHKLGFIPQTALTMGFCNDAENTLAAGAWPPPTLPQGGYKDFVWEYQHRRIHVCDIAGEDWIDFAKKEQENKNSILNSNQDSPEKEIAKRFYSAILIFIVLDLEEELNCGKNQRQYDLVTAVRNVINNAHERYGKKLIDTRICFVVTKFNTLGIPESHVFEKIEPYYRLIYDLNFLRHTPDIIHVDAVADTVTNDVNGFSFPAKEYRSIGLEKIKSKIEELIYTPSPPFPPSLKPDNGCLVIAIIAASVAYLELMGIIIIIISS